MFCSVFLCIFLSICVLFLSFISLSFLLLLFVVLFVVLHSQASADASYVKTYLWIKTSLISMTIDGLCFNVNNNANIMWLFFHSNSVIIRQKYIHILYPEIIMTHFHGCFPHLGWASETYWRVDRCRIQKPMKGWIIPSLSRALGITHLLAVTYSFYRSVCLSLCCHRSLSLFTVSFLSLCVNPVLCVCLSSCILLGIKYLAFMIYLQLQSFLPAQSKC